MDEGALLVYPDLVFHGHVPYRDFETFYGPANPYVIGAAYSVFGTSIFVERAVGLIYRLAILAALFGLLRRWGTSVAAACTLVAGGVLLMTQLVAYAWLGGVACLLCALWVLAAPAETWRAFAGGLLAGAALLFRPDLAPAVALAVAPLFWVMPARDRARFCSAGLVAMIPFVLLAFITGPSALLNNLFLTPVIHSNPGRRLPILEASSFNLRLLSAHLFAVIANVAAAVISFRRDRGNRQAPVMLALALFALALTPQALQRLDTLHLVAVAFLSIGLLPLSALTFFHRADAQCPHFARGVWASFFAVVVLLGAIAPKVWTDAGNAFAAAIDPSMGSATFLEQNGRSFPFPSPHAAAVTGKLLEKLDRLARPGERLFVGPADLRRTNTCDTFIYYLFPSLVPATYFLEMNPLSANRPGSRLATDVASADWVVLDMTWDSWHEKNDSAWYGSEAPNNVVRSQFHLVGQYAPFVLLQRNQ
ncbi:MAG: hypothetical protein M3Z64_05020 [Verrucomicrobiota bacterium]|nr:hypothetical protein [Verrucomicrobiota bacterium]